MLALPVMQQPSGDSIYVFDKDGEVTQFGMAGQYENVGLLAHNHKAGKSFSQMMIGQEVQLICGDRRAETFVVGKVQALHPTNPYSYFKSLDDNELLTATRMFNRVYGGPYHLTFQTCIAAEGELSWGRLFGIAFPKRDTQAPYRQRR